MQRLFLIGDAGELKDNRQPVLDWLAKNVNWNDEKNVALFLGDNIYPDGMPDEGSAEYAYTRKVIDYQIGLVRGKKGKAFFVPGNHDWKGGKIGGWERVLNQVNYINSLQAPNVRAWPLNGCPGPVPVELNEKVLLVMMDSQWFLHIHDKPGAESSCEARSIEEFTAELRQIAESHPNQLLVLVMHHPMYTFGVHGGAYSLKQHLFPFADAIKGFYVPLPILGSVYPLARGLFGSLQDSYHPLYRTMINEIEQVLKDHPNPIAVAGHEHSLQLIMKDSIPYIVSGSAAKLTRLRKGKELLFSTLDYGFSVLEVRKSGKVEVKYHTLESSDMSAPLYARELKTIVPITPKAAMDTLLPVMGAVQVPASSTMNEGRIRNFLWGKNYRREWKEPVGVPTLDLGGEAGGLKPVRQQGSQQTKTLTLADKSGKEWVLRYIERFPPAAIPSDLRTELQNKTLNRGVSGVYPYASLSVPVLEKAVGIPTVRRKLVFVPDDPRLDRFRTGFKNSLAILEEREPVSAGKTIGSDDLITRLRADNSNQVDQRAVLRARLMDNFVMDFDRHEAQFRWAVRDSGGRKTYFPIPRDHDQAFFENQGLLAAFLRQPWFMPETQGFGPRAQNIKTFNRTARNFDRFYLNSLSAQDWQQETDTFINRLTDEIIDAALLQQPVEIRKFRASEISRTLKKRKAYFRNEMMAYYRFLSRQVDVLGSDQKDFFLIARMQDGRVRVTATSMVIPVATPFYDRTFDPDITRELRIYALENDDSVVIAGGRTPILVRIIGGAGKDVFEVRGDGSNVKLYDASFEPNRVWGDTASLDRHFISDPEVNRYNRFGFRYNYIDPGVFAAYNRDDGVLVSLQLDYFKQGFRRNPYSMRQSLRMEKAFGTGSFRFRYESDYVKVLKSYDINVRADFKGPDYVTNFFGIGNNTAFDKSKGIGYFRTHYNAGNLSLLLGKQLQSWMRVGLGPTVQFLSTSRNENNGKLVTDAGLKSADSAVLFQDKWYAGLEGRLDINSRNNAAVPTRGALISAYARQLWGLNAPSKPLLQAGLDLRIFMSFVPQTKLVLATRFGMARNFGHFEFQQAQYLSGTENLRGYRRERFAGRGMMFNNTELRLKLIEFPTYIFSTSIGVVAFHDVGRVWADDESSRRWHTGYGGGLWIAPIRRFVLVGTLSYSKEEKALPMVSVGFQF
ncbi:metallophosphoesterase [Flaviaesturariibacter amylovorans]|uniref:metallophosphoesterase n=1 Tax=Flaviaesturariibacter amylovorans TaxID=1084520 RepID=UPI0031EBA3B8